MEKEAVYLTCTDFGKMFEADANLTYYWISQGWVNAGRIGARYVIDKEYAEEILAEGERVFPNFRKSLWPRMVYRYREGQLRHA